MKKNKHKVCTTKIHLPHIEYFTRLSDDNFLEKCSGFQPNGIITYHCSYLKLIHLTYLQRLRKICRFCSFLCYQ